MPYRKTPLGATVVRLHTQPEQTGVGCGTVPIVIARGGLVAIQPKRTRGAARGLEHRTRATRFRTFQDGPKDPDDPPVTRSELR